MPVRPLPSPPRAWRTEAPADAFPVAWSGHAVDRYRERLRPALTDSAVRHELAMLLASATVTPTAPDWFIERDRAHAYLRIGADICAPLRKSHRNDELIAATVMFRGQLSEKTRAVKAERGRVKRAAKHARRRAYNEPGRPREPFTRDDWEVT